MEGTHRLRHDQRRLTIYSLPRPSHAPGLAEDAEAGLTASPKSLPPKYFYDERGSALFDQICLTPEYYPTRTEDALLATHAVDVIRAAEPVSLLELGSGASRKTHHLLDASAQLGFQCVYQPMDVCAEIMVDAGQRLAARHHWLDVEAIVGDYVHGLRDLPPGHGPRLFAFLGGTIGNFEEDEAAEFLRDLCAVMKPDDWFLLGADRVKDTHVLNAAYNDAQGYTAEFNLNVLRVMNRELGADFALDSFRHHAFFNEQRAQIEMHLVSGCAQSVRIPGIGRVVRFEQGESILTEISRKFTRASLEQLVRDAGMTVVRQFQPSNGYFSLVLARRGTRSS